MSDPVADKSGFLCMYMSNHPDTLVAYAKWFGKPKVTEPITGARMTGIDTKSMTLTCSMKDGSQQAVVVPIDPPLAGYDDVKPRLLEMKALAQEGLGMIKAPHITDFVFPLRGAINTGLVVGAITYAYLAPSESSLGASSSPPLLPLSLFAPVHFLRAHVGEGVFAVTFWAVLVGHVLESAYTLSLCRKHSTGFFTAAQYVLSTLVFGYPIWVSLRKRIQSARIDSVMKVE